LTRLSSRHFDDVDIEAFLYQAEGHACEPGEPPTRDPEVAREHLAGCNECHQRLLMNKDAHQRLKSLRLEQHNVRSKNCPEAVDWPSVAAGLVPEAEARKFLEHASNCPHCGYNLKSAMADLSDEPSAEEEAIFASLKSNTTDWKLAMAQKLREATPQAPPRKRFSWKFLFRAPMLAFASLLVVAAVTISVTTMSFRKLKMSQAPSLSNLVASAYSDYRTMDLRIQGAACSPKQVQRSASGSNVDRPLSLLRAEELIHDGLQAHPNDASLLDAKARVDMIDGSPETAIDALQRALETEPNSTTIWTDLATAYFMRAEKNHGAIDYGRAIEQLDKVLAVSPDDSVALFNRAIAEDRMQLFNVEIEDWKKFLKVEKDPGWRTEGQNLYESAQKKVESQPHSSWVPRHSPLEAISALKAMESQPPGKGPDALLDEVILTDALAQWLPSLAALKNASDRSPPEDINARREALKALAIELRTQHQDPWLSDLLAGPRSPTWEAGILELSSAARAHTLGQLSDILLHASRALQLFQSSKNAAGESAARLQYQIGTNRSVLADKCRKAAFDALHQLSPRAYPWIESYSLFEASTCSFMIGRQEDALDYARKAAVIARQAHYNVLELKGAMYLDGVATTSIASTDSWDRIRAGLAEFWAAPYPSEQGEDFYSDLGYAAQDEGMWHCAETIFQESLVIHSTDANQFKIASTHHRLAKAAEAAGDDALAESEYRRASEILTGLGRGANLVRIELDIERAALEVTQGKYPIADAHLQAVAADLPTISNHYALIPYYESVGELHLNTGKPLQAEKELLAAIRLIEEDKRTLLSETDLLTWQRDTSQAYRSLLRLYTQSPADDAKAFSLLEWYRAGPIRGASVRSQQERVAEGAPDLAQFIPYKLKFRGHGAVLTWISFPSSLSLFLLNESGLHTASTAVTKEEMDTTAKRFIRLCADPLSDRAALDRDARQLYQWLIQPLAGQLGGVRKLTVEPDDSFGPIPFELLETTEGEYLGDRFPIAESPGIGYTRLLRTDERISSRDTALVVGDPALGGKTATRFRPLPEASREASNVAAHFEHHFVLIGEDASLQNLVKFLPQAEIFHFAGHGMSEGNEKGLVLSSLVNDPNRPVLLDQKQLHNRDLKRLKLVVLSGCDTGLAEQGWVDPGSLVRVFLRAGVPDVIASRWPIDSDSSAELMNQVYASLIRGTSVDQALAAAKRSLRSKPQTAHPYYWAAFSMFGR
jgi:CHAT domain-containing protein/cytochrome c-type biogenesis protein CcmH/NrfG